MLLFGSNNPNLTDSWCRQNKRPFSLTPFISSVPFFLFSPSDSSYLNNKGNKKKLIVSPSDGESSQPGRDKSAKGILWLYSIGKMNRLAMYPFFKEDRALFEGLAEGIVS